MDVRMEVLHPDAEPFVVGGQVLRHPLRQSRHEDPLALFRPLADLAEEVVHLVGYRLHNNLRIHETRGPDDLLHDLPRRLAQLVGRRCRRNVDPLVLEGRELIETERPVVEGGGEAEAVVDQGLLSRPIAPVHRIELGNGGMALIDEDEGVLGQVFHQRRRRLTRFPAREMAGVVLDPRAVPHLLHHFDIEMGPLLQPLRLQELVFRIQFAEPLSQFHADVTDRLFQIVLRRHVVTARIDRRAAEPLDLLPPEGIDDGDRLDRIAEEFHPDRPFLFIGRKDLHDVPPDAEGPPVEIDVVPLVLNLDQAGEDRIPRDLHPLFEQEEHPVVGLRRTETVNARDAGHDDHVTPFEEIVRRRVAELVDLIIDRGVLLDVGVRTGDVGLRLVVIVVTDEVRDGIFRKEGLELPVELGGKGLVVGDDEGGSIDGGDHVRHREGLPGTGHPEEDLMLLSFLQPCDQFGDRLRLIPPRFKPADQMKRPHALPPRRRILSQFPGDGKTAKP